MTILKTLLIKGKNIQAFNVKNLLRKDNSNLIDLKTPTPDGYYQVFYCNQYHSNQMIVINIQQKNKNKTKQKYY